MIVKEIGNLIGETPLYLATNLMKKYGLTSNLYLKLEKYNFTGSAKDRLAYQILQDAKEEGELKTGGTIIEPTSGNTGISLAGLCANYGYRCVIVMPDGMSKERINLIKAYGAEVVLTSKEKGMQGAIEKAKEIQKEINNSYVPNQFENESGVKAHYLTTGREIYQDLNGKVDIMIASIGTGATFTGTAKYLKEQNLNIKCIGVEPKNSAILNSGKANLHKIQGIGANFIPKILDRSLIDEVKDVSDEDAYYYTNELAKTEGLLCGISSGATISQALEICRNEQGKNVVAILADGGERYISMGELWT